MTTRRRKGWRARCGCAPEDGVTTGAPAREGQPWWQGAWQALGGLFNLLAVLAGRWPRHSG